MMQPRTSGALMRVNVLRFSAKKFSKLMEARGFNPNSLASKMGVSTTWVQNLEAGKVHMPRRIYFELLATTLGVNQSDLLEDDENPDGGGNIDVSDSLPVYDPTIEDIHTNLLAMRDLDPDEVESVKVVVQAMLKRLQQRKREDEERKHPPRRGESRNDQDGST